MLGSIELINWKWNFLRNSYRTIISVEFCLLIGSTELLISLSRLLCADSSMGFLCFFFLVKTSIPNIWNIKWIVGWLWFSLCAYGEIVKFRVLWRHACDCMVEPVSSLEYWILFDFSGRRMYIWENEFVSLKYINLRLSHSKDYSSWANRNYNVV